MHTSLIAAAVATAAVAAPAPAAAAHFTARVDNPWFPLRPGMRWVYRGVEDGHRLRDVVHVTGRVARIAGAPCAVVRDRLYHDGRLEETTLDYYAQDARGTVWYFGERTAELDRRGHVRTREGSWRAGVRGARPGIFMPRDPRVGQVFQQEHFAGHAEDRFRVRGRLGDVTLETGEWSPLEPGVRDRKWYVHGIGQVAERTVKGGRETAHLASFRGG
jgi:hypothetical protein